MILNDLISALGRWQNALEVRRSKEANSDYDFARPIILAQIHNMRKLLYAGPVNFSELATWVDRWALALRKQTDWPALHSVAEHMFHMRDRLLAQEVPSPMDPINHMVHRLWTKAVGTDGYVKKEWKDLDTALWDLFRAAQWIDDGFQWLVKNEPAALVQMPGDKLRFMRLAGETLERLLKGRKEETMGKNIEDMTISEVNRTLAEADELRKVLAAQGRAEQAKHPWIGEKVFIRTVTYHYTGRVVSMTADEVELIEAAWIAEDGRFADTMRTGEFAEVEPYLPDQPVRIARGAIVDWTLWRHKLPSEQK